MSKKPKSISSPPSKEELTLRISRLRSMMENENLDFYVCFDPVNIYYLTNFAFYVHERPFLLVIGKEGPPKFIVPLLEKAHVMDRALVDLDFVDYYEFPAPKGRNWFDYYQATLSNESNIGIESSMPMGIANKTPGNKKVIDLVEEIRIIKSDYEVGRSVHACKVVNKGHKKLLKICKPGFMEFAIFQEVSKTMTSKIIQDMPNANFKVCDTLGAVWPPNISHEPHLVPDIFAKMEEGGPHVSIVQAQVDGYGVEIERTFFLGTVPDKAKKPFDTIYKARELAYSLVKPGKIMSEIDREVRKFLTKEGYGDYILHRTGHGLGITGHEAPYIAEGYDRPLKANMLISIEPGIYIPDIGGFRHSDTVLVADDGYIKLTRAPETLEEVTISL
ncbi:MAG: M24 family metallopeptidase [Candidatus Lokiarchaeota archaeon]|nr:M24 family metallopeptidase [Candidatus Lokiarchaeota archaeon]MBD3341029.1 M24 family metallopeptidase [Candidatus Lokiarchaeota archaeon]